MSRLRDGQLGDARVHDIGNYIVRGKLWEAFAAEQPTVVLIDEIDKADIEFPNDLLLELDRMQFHVYETRRDGERQPPPGGASSPPTTRRSCRTRSCAAASSTTSASPTARRWSASSPAHYPGIKQELAREALTTFFRLREVPGLKKKPATSELLDWLKLLMVEDLPPEALRSTDAHVVIPPLHGALLKNEQDVHLFERLAFLSRRGG